MQTTNIFHGGDGRVFFPAFPLHDIPEFPVTAVWMIQLLAKDRLQYWGFLHLAVHSDTA